MYGAGTTLVCEQGDGMTRPEHQEEGNLQAEQLARQLG